MATKTESPVLDDWADEVDYDSTVSRKAQPIVPVPDSLVELLGKARDENRRPAWKIRDVEHYNERRAMLYSAGLKLDPPASVLITPGIMATPEGGQPQFTKVAELKDATHIRASVGNKRGGRGKSDDSDAASE
jgi:hypothetical protein